MADKHEYFLRTAQDRTGRETESMWRRAGGAGTWEYFSLIDWSWHPVKPSAPAPRVPEPESLRPISAEQATALAADRPRWCLYWARYSGEPQPGEQPSTIIRRKPSPESLVDEVFSADNEWVPTRSVFEFYDPRPSNPPHLVEVGAEEAERIIRRRREIEGSTSQ